MSRHHRVLQLHVPTAHDVVAEQHQQQLPYNALPRPGCGVWLHQDVARHAGEHGLHHVLQLMSRTVQGMGQA